MEIMKIVVPVFLLLISKCLAVDNVTNKFEQQLNVQKREKQYLIEDEPIEGPEQKRDERQSTPVKNNHNLDLKRNSKIINLRITPSPNILPAPKQPIKPGPQRIPTNIPVVLKTAKVVPGPAHAIRIKMLENRINETLYDANKENKLSPNKTPQTTNKDSIPFYTIEDKTTRRSESNPNPNSVVTEKLDLRSNETLNRDSLETPKNKDKNSLNKNTENLPLKEVKEDRTTSDLEKKPTVQKPVHFFVDEPEPLPPSFSRKQIYENSISQDKEVIPNKRKEIPIVKKESNKTRKYEIRKKENENNDENDPGIVKISNGTHLITIKKIENNNNLKIMRCGEEITVPTEERIINQEPPKPEPEKNYFTVTEKSNIGKEEQNVGLNELAFTGNKNKDEKGQNNCITKHNLEEKAPILPPITIQPTNSPKVSGGNQESWNYLQNPYYNPYYRNICDQYRKAYGLTQSTPNTYGQEITDSRSYGAQSNPYTYGQAAIDPYVPEFTAQYYPNSNPTTYLDSIQYPYSSYTYENQPVRDSTACAIHQVVRPENTLDRTWKNSNDVEISMRNVQRNSVEVPLNIDIRRDIDDNNDGAKLENGIGKVVYPYAASSLPININGVLVYPYVNPSSRYMR